MPIAPRQTARLANNEHFSDMEWLNLHTSVLDSPEFVGEEPVCQATWIKLLRFCIGQENGGRIHGCRGWKDRKWQQLVRVTKREAETASELITWEGDDLIVMHYPLEKELEVKTKRENGKKGGRPKTGTKPKPCGSDSDNPEPNQAGTSSPTTPETEGEGKSKGMEGEERESVREDDHGQNAMRIIEAYPRREKTAEAAQIVAGHLAEGDDFELMLAGTKACAAVIRTLPSGHLNRYVPSAVSFFRDRRWKDDPETLKRQGSSSTGQGQMNLEEAKKQLGRRGEDL